MDDQRDRTARLDAIIQEIREAADRLRPITAAINRGDTSLIGDSNRIQYQIKQLYDRRDARQGEEDRHPQS